MIARYQAPVLEEKNTLIQDFKADQISEIILEEECLCVCVLGGGGGGGPCLIAVINWVNLTISLL